MGRKLKIDTGEPKLGPYTPGINVKDHIWLSGQIDIESGADIESQTIGTLAKIDDLLAAANSSKGDLVKVTILMVDIGFYTKVNEIYSEWLGDTIPPARAAYEVSKLPGGALIEIVCEAFRNSGEYRTDLPAELEEALV
jgi:2-iminobutanoate/2-iminopropanoate deaminase|tara:strand:- start:2904 stop:3320 length:417 start_codon:yes stop_codon:yes gene_type:complete